MIGMFLFVPYIIHNIFQFCRRYIGFMLFICELNFFIFTMVITISFPMGLLEDESEKYTKSVPMSVNQ